MKPKKHWTRLERHPRNAYASERDAMSAHLYEFQKEHVNADEIIVKDGDILAAVYFSIAGKNKEHLVSILRAIRDRLGEPS